MIGKVLPGPGEPGEPSGQPVDILDRPLWVWWKIKKWALQVIARVSCILSVCNSIGVEVVLPYSCLALN